MIVKFRDAMTSRTMKRSVGIAGLAALLLPPALLATFLSMLDHGAFDHRIDGWASAHFERPIHVGAIHFNLLSRLPTLSLRNLVIANPSWIGHGYLAEIDRADVRIDLLPLLFGTIRPRGIAISGARLHLTRYGPGRNNWTFTDHPKPGPAFAPLAGVTRLSIAKSPIDIDDYGRGLILSGSYRHDPDGARPFHLQAQGTLKGYAVALLTASGQINGTGVGPAWPFRARLVDAATTVNAQGVSAEPFDLSRFDLGIAACGPNLADLGYLFNLAMPNSRPYHLEARAKADGKHFGFSNIVGTIGQSDVRGWIKADHSQVRHSLVADFHAGTLTRADVDALLAPVPPRAEARQSSGTIKSVATGRWILPDAAFGLGRLRASDFTFFVLADRTTGYALPLRAVSTRIVADHGQLRFERLRGELYSGKLEGDGLLDARSDIPRISVRGRLRDARLSEIAPGAGQSGGAVLSIAADIIGSGVSLHAAAAHARGSLSGQVSDITIPRRAAWMLGGDLLRAVGNVGSAQAPGNLAVACASGALHSAGGGQFNVSRLGLQSALGTASGTGFLDLGQERLSIVLEGRADAKRPFQVAMPIRIEGSLVSPKVTLLPGRKARALGLKGVLGVALTPIVSLLPIKPEGTAPQPVTVSCE